jgi:hypothetical protein
MMVHKLKILPQYFQPIRAGKKTFEVRKNDRGFQAGDEVVLKEWDPDLEECVDENPIDGRIFTKGHYTGNEKTFGIGYVLPIDAERVVFSLIEVE